MREACLGGSEASVSVEVMRFLESKRRVQLRMASRILTRSLLTFFVFDNLFVAVLRSASLYVCLFVFCLSLSICRLAYFEMHMCKFLLRPQERWRTIVMSTFVCVCVCVCLSVREHMSRRDNFWNCPGHSKALTIFAAAVAAASLSRSVQQGSFNRK